MVLDTAGNFVRSNVDSQVAAGATTVSVTDVGTEGAKGSFPNPSTSTAYNCVLWDASLGSPYQDPDVEVVRVTAVDYTNNDLTVTRAQEGTTDVSHPSTSAIQLSPTSKMMSDVDSSLETIADFSTNEVTADVNNASVTTNAVNTDRVYDSTGRYLGTLTGSGDAQVLIDAIADRQGTSDVILPAPDFDLGWEQQVDLPTENDFKLQTRGTPRLAIQSGFSDSFAIHLPTSSETTRMEIGRLAIDDDANNAIGTAAMRLNDLERSDIHGPHVLGAAGIQLRGVNNTPADNTFYSPRVRSAGNGTGFETIDAGLPVNANTVYHMRFGDGGNNVDIGIHDTGKQNSWKDYHFENGDIAFRADGSSNGENYHVDFGYVEPGSWTYLVEEVNGAQGGLIDLAGAEDDFAKMRLVSPDTEIRGASRRESGSTESGGPFDAFAHWQRATPTMTTTVLGIDTSFNQNGSVNIRPNIDNLLECVAAPGGGGSAGDRAEAFEGEQFKVTERASKIFAFVKPEGTQSITRFGFHNNSNNFAELVADPTGSYSALPSSTNWNLWVQTGGTDRVTADTGVAIGNADIGVQRESLGTTATWSAVINGSVVASGSNGGNAVGFGGARLYCETRDGAERSAQIDIRRKMRHWVT